MRVIYIIIFINIALCNAWGQDLRFSQFFNSPLSTNPANTGFLPYSDYRLGAHYREQWASIPVPYTTMSIYGDFQVLRNLISTGWFGVGGLIFQDMAGSGTLRSTKTYASVAYHQMLGNASLLSGGFNIGFVGKRVNTSNLRFGDMWDGKFSMVQPARYLSTVPLGIWTCKLDSTMHCSHPKMYMCMWV